MLKPRLLPYGLVAAFITLVPITAFCRRLESWPYQKLLAEADLVVIAKVTKVTPKDGDAPAVFGKTRVSGELVLLNVQMIVKGVEMPSVDVMNYRLAPDTLVKDGPELIKYRNEGLSIEEGNSRGGNDGSSRTGAPSYLLFLKKSISGDYYEPVSGFYDAALSAREVTAPLGD